MESPMRGWLLSKVPDWDDDVMCAARFKALTGQRADWEGRFQFWRQLIIDVARHLNLLVVDTHAVQHSWFLRAGLTPLCINQVLVEMHKCGDLQNLHNSGGGEWFWQRIWKRVMWGNSDMCLTSDNIAGRLVVTALMHDHVNEVIKSLSENCWTASCVTTMEHLISVCGGEEEASIVTRELIRMKRGRFFLADGSSPIKGLKVSMSQDHVLDVTKLDSYMLHLFWTLEKLNAQMVALEKAYSRSKASAIKVLKQDRTTAKKHLHSMRTIAATQVKCAEFHGKIQEVVAYISQAEMTKQVSEALKVGAHALKEHAIPLEDIEECVQEVDEAISNYQEVANVLGSPPASVEYEDEELELQLADLELEIFAEENKAPIVIENIACHDDSQGLPKTPAASLEAIENDLKGLSLA